MRTDDRLIVGREHFASSDFQSKLAFSRAAIGATLTETKARKPYVALSGGKDSLVVGCLVESVAGEVPMAWSDDELEYPETVAFLGQFTGDPSFIVTRGGSIHAGWFRPWTDRPYWRDPLPGMQPCDIPQDDWMAARGHDLTFLGTRAGESRKRRDWLLTAKAMHGAWYPVKGGTGCRCCPIWDWTEDDVWAVIAGWGLSYNTAYDVLERIGIPRHRQRVGPLPLVPRSTLADGWGDLIDRLESRYGQRWTP